MENHNFVPVPQPKEITHKERERSLAAYFMMFFTSLIGLPLPLINLLASWIYHESTKKTSRFVHFHSLQSLYSQLPLTIFNLTALIWTIRVLINRGSLTETEGFTESDFSDFHIGFLILVSILNLVYYIFSIVAAVNAYKGKMYYFLFFGRLAYTKVFKANNSDYKPKEVINLPPKL